MVDDPFSNGPWACSLTLDLFTILREFSAMLLEAISRLHNSASDQLASLVSRGARISSLIRSTSSDRIQSNA